MGYRKQHHVAGDTVITESKQNIPWGILVRMCTTTFFLVATKLQGQMHWKFFKNCNSIIWQHRKEWGLIDALIY